MRLHNEANELTSRIGGTVPLAYDDAGNMRTQQLSVGGATRTFTHDAWNRLVKISDGANENDTYAYNGLHWRVLKTVARTSLDEQREMMYSSAWQLLQEHIDDAYSTNPGTDRVAQEVWGPRYVDDAVVRRMRTTSGNVDPTTYYHITDAQFSTMAMLQGAVLKERVEFDAYGRARHYWASDVDGDGAVTQGDQNAITAAANANPQLLIGASGYNAAMDINRDGVIDLLDVFAFVAQANRPALAAGQISDPAGPDNLIGYDGYVFNMENTLYTVRFRHYDPQLGRWVQRDPIEFVDGSNLFQYVDSMPVVLADPAGLGPIEWLLTGDWDPDPEILAGAKSAYCRSVWDRTNGTMDAVTFRNYDLEDIYSLDYTFNPDDRANAACVAACMLDSIINAGLPMPPGVFLKVFQGLGIDLSIHPKDWAPGSFDLAGRILEKRARGSLRWRIRKGRIGGDMGLLCEKGTDIKKRGSRIRKAGKAVMWAALMYDLAISCWDKCARPSSQCAQISNGIE